MTRGKGESRSEEEAEKLGYSHIRRRHIGRLSPSPRILETDEVGYANGSLDSFGRKSSWFSSWPKSGGHDGTHSPIGSPHDTSGVEARDVVNEGRDRGRRGSRLEEFSRQGSVIFGFEDSDDSTDDSEYEKFEEVEQEEDRYIETTGSELGESDGYSGGDDKVEFVEGGGKALL